MSQKYTLWLSKIDVGHLEYRIDKSKKYNYKNESISCR